MATLLPKIAYIQKLHARIDEWNADIDKLRAKADLVEADSKKVDEKLSRKINPIFFSASKDRLDNLTASPEFFGDESNYK